MLQEWVSLVVRIWLGPVHVDVTRCEHVCTNRKCWYLFSQRFGLPGMWAFPSWDFRDTEEKNSWSETFSQLTDGSPRKHTYFSQDGGECGVCVWGSSHRIQGPFPQPTAQVFLPRPPSQFCFPHTCSPLGFVELSSCNWTEGLSSVTEADFSPSSWVLNSWAFYSWVGARFWWYWCHETFYRQG